MRGIDILMVTYNRPEYVRLSLPHLLSTCPPEARVWLWHNGTDQETLAAVEEHRDHPRVHRFHHSRDNAGLRPATNWLFTEATGDFLSKVDDDCLPEPGWIERLRQAHDDVAEFGVIGCWRFPDEDLNPRLMARKLADYPGGHRLLRNHWVQGSGYLAKRELVAEVGAIAEGGNFTRWCLDAARAGYVNGWYHPFIREDHADDPRSPNTIYTTDEEFMARRPLSAKATGVTTLAEWTAQMRRSAHVVQAASLDLRHYEGWRLRRRNLVRRAKFKLFGKARW